MTVWGTCDLTNPGGHRTKISITRGKFGSKLEPVWQPAKLANRMDHGQYRELTRCKLESLLLFMSETEQYLMMLHMFRRRVPSLNLVPRLMGKRMI